MFQAPQAWPLDVREARQALLRPSLSAGWALTEHAAMTRSDVWEKPGKCGRNALSILP